MRASIRIEPPSAVDLDAIHAFLTTSYWSPGVAREVVAQRDRALVDVDHLDLWHRRTSGELRGEALLSGTVDDEVADRQSVPRVALEIPRIDLLDDLGQRGGLTFEEIEGRIGRVAGARGREDELAQSRRWSQGLGRADPRRGVTQALGLAGQDGIVREELLDGVRLVGLARIERVRAEQLLDLGVGQFRLRRHHSAPCASSASAIRRSPSRSRDLAVPSGIPSTSATCRYVLPPKYASWIARC